MAHALVCVRSAYGCTRIIEGSREEVRAAPVFVHCDERRARGDGGVVDDDDGEKVAREATRPEVLFVEPTGFPNRRLLRLLSGCSLASRSRRILTSAQPKFINVHAKRTRARHRMQTGSGARAATRHAV